jgi:methyl-accepting chemotaxis protein
MNAYLSLVPAGVQNDDFQNWFAVLQEVKHLRRDGVKVRVKNQELQTGIDQLRANLEKALEANKMLHNETGNLREINSRMKEAIENLREMNNRMKETIETLKNLDSQMEERRRLIK